MRRRDARAAFGAGLLSVFVLVACEQPVAPRSGPRLAAAEPRVELPAAAPGTVVMHQFAISNEGARDLRLWSLLTSCDCSAMATPPAVLAPGESGSVSLQCTATGTAGPRRHTVTIYSNDAQQPAVTLAVAMETQADIAPLQAAYYFGRARRGQRTARDIRLRLDDAAMVPRSARSSGGNFEARLERRSDDEWRIALTVVPGAPIGVVEDVILVDTASPRQPQLSIPVLGRVEDPAT